MTVAFGARELAVQREQAVVLSLPDLEVQAGRTLVVLGPNGAGKSTLLRVAGLLERPSRGSLAVLGETVTPDRRQQLTLRRRMASVFQDPLLTDATVLENVLLGLGFRGVRPAEAGARASAWLERFGILHLAGRRAQTLSGGEAQRASLARAFVLEPELLLLDEPFGSLDHHGREVLALELREILKEAHLTTIFVTHERSEALLLADAALALMHGQVVQRGTPREIFERPRSLALARFVGMENLFDGSQGDRLHPALSGAPASAHIAIRAEDIVLGEADRAVPEGAIGVAARVVRVVPAGVQYRVELDAGLPLVALVEKRVVARQRPEAGKEVRAWFDREVVHFIRPDETGREPRVG
jgi:tungstate transport system ATP-binding protein